MSKRYLLGFVVGLLLAILIIEIFNLGAVNSFLTGFILSPTMGRIYGRNKL